jgi:hypothetical protein
MGAWVTRAHSVFAKMAPCDTRTTLCAVSGSDDRAIEPVRLAQ